MLREGAVRGVGVARPAVQYRRGVYDSVFEELPVALNAYRDGCGNLPLTTQLIWDRGLQKVTTTIDPATAQTVTKYDPFGRIVEVDQPSADTLGGLASLPALRVDWSKVDQPNTNVAGASVHFTTPAGESYVFYDNFGRPRYRLSPAETAGSWIVSGAAQLAPTGRPQNAYVPFLWSGSDPTLALGALLPVASNNAGSYTYDALGRPLVVTGTDGATTASFSYHPLETDIQDGEQILPAGPGTDGSSSPHGGSYTAIQLYGRGQTVSVAKHLLNDPVDTITTSVTRQATGEVLTLRQIHAANASDSYARSMTYDSLGRLVLNVEPNTSTTTQGVVQAWRYAYDDAGDLVGTSDARGCGENISYDGLGRIAGEDYSPCAPNQAAYTRPGINLAGWETYYHYDDPIFEVTDQGAFAGKLTAMGDRASWTQIAYDARGRAIAEQRQLAVPNTSGADLPIHARYAPHLFERDISYDEANRALNATTGADPAVFGMTVAPRIWNHYTPRGTIGSIDGDFGILLASQSFNPDGSLHQQVFGDVANTTADFDYWTNGRVKSAHVHRPAGAWLTASGYTPPSAPAPTTLEDDLEHTVITYDNAGNPKSILDIATGQWPTGALPPSRFMNYDDNYRLRAVSTQYGPTFGADAFAFPPYAPEAAAGDTTFPPMKTTVPTRVAQQGYTYDWLGNMSSSSDDQNVFLDRSLGAIKHGENGAGPHQMTSATLGSSSATVSYDAAGNVTAISPKADSPYTYQYFWDELGQLAIAQRVAIVRVPPGVFHQVVEAAETFTNGASGQRVLTELTVGNAAPTYSATVFPSLRLEGTSFPDANGDYARTPPTQTVVLASGGMRLGRVVYSGSDPPLSSDPRKVFSQHVFLEIGDHLGSTSFVIDQATSEVVERPTYQAYGAAESDFRTPRWSNFRESVRYTGHEDDAAVGLVYFGHRYYSPAISRWVSPDPLTIHGLGADVNPYAFVSGSPLGLVDPTGLGNCDPTVQSCPKESPTTSNENGDEEDNGDESGGGGGTGGGAGTGGGGPGSGNPIGAYLSPKAVEAMEEAAARTDAADALAAARALAYRPPTQGLVAGGSAVPAAAGAEISIGAAIGEGALAGTAAFGTGVAIVGALIGVKNNYFDPMFNGVPADEGESEGGAPSPAPQAAAGGAGKRIGNGGSGGSVDLHHAWPKYLGGAVDQDLIPLNSAIHDKFHAGLDKILPRQLGTAYYNSLSSTARQQVLSDLANYTKNFDAMYGTQIYQAMINNGFPAGI